MEEYAAIGKIVPLHRGEYSDTTAYRINDIVTYQKATYWHSAAEPTTGVPPTEESAWKLVNPPSPREAGERTNYNETDSDSGSYLRGKEELDRKIDGKMETRGGSFTGAIGIKGIVLTEGVDYGDTLPETVIPGKLFFLKEG